MEQANKSLSYHLDEIQNINSALADSSKIKEEYVGLYMEQYTNYITQIDSFKKRALKIAKSEDINKVVSFLKSSLNTEGDLAEFYNNFDKAILNLFPNFVADFNALLSPENAIIPGTGKLLTPELRIFALIRLGITDSVKIAHFLQYSLSTITITARNREAKLLATVTLSKKEWDVSGNKSYSHHNKKHPL